MTLKLKLKPNKALYENSSLSYMGVTCHMGSHSLTCQPTQVKRPASTQASSAVSDKSS